MDFFPLLDLAALYTKAKHGIFLTPITVFLDANFLIKTSSATQNKPAQLLLFPLGSVLADYQGCTNDVKGQVCQSHPGSFIVIYHPSESLFIDGAYRTPNK